MNFEIFEDKTDVAFFSNRNFSRICILENGMTRAMRARCTLAFVFY